MKACGGRRGFLPETGSAAARGRSPEGGRALAVGCRRAFVWRVFGNLRAGRGNVEPGAWPKL